MLFKKARDIGFFVLYGEMLGFLTFPIRWNFSWRLTIGGLNNRHYRLLSETRMS